MQESESITNKPQPVVGLALPLTIMILFPNPFFWINKNFNRLEEIIMMDSTVTPDNRMAAHTRTTPRAVSISPELVNQITKITEIVGFTVGPALVAFNLFNFNLAKIGFFYKDPARIGIAAGVFLIAAAWYIAKSRK
jgi:hypothetical protein